MPEEECVLLASGSVGPVLSAADPSAAAAKGQEPGLTIDIRSNPVKTILFE